MKNTLTALLLCLLALTGCATRNLPLDRALDPAGPNGVVMGSITYTGAFPAAYSVFYRPIGRAAAPAKFSSGEAVMQVARAAPNEFVDHELKGNLFVAELPPGEYEVFNWQVATGRTHASAVDAFSLRFTVAPGRVTYLGNFAFAQLRNISVEVGVAEVVHRDAIERDLSVFRSRYTRLADAPVTPGVEAGAVTVQLGGRAAAQLTQPLNVRF